MSAYTVSRLALDAGVSVHIVRFTHMIVFGEYRFKQVVYVAINSS